MKLAYKDKILLLLLVIAITSFLAYIIAVRPNIQKIKDSDKARTTAQEKLDKVENDIRRLKIVEKNINEYTEKCAQASNTFLKHTPNFDSDRFVQKMLNDNNLLFTKLVIEGPEVIDLVGYKFTPTILSYPLGGTYNVSDPYGINKKNSGVVSGQTSLPAVNINMVIYGKNENIENFFNGLCQKQQMSVVLTEYNEQQVDSDTSIANVKMIIYFLQPVEVKAEN